MTVEEVAAMWNLGGLGRKAIRIARPGQKVWARRKKSIRVCGEDKRN